MQRILLAALAGLVAVAGLASAQTWHDAGTDLGPLGPNPLATATGACWTADTDFVNPASPGFAQPESVNGQPAGAGVDESGACDPQAPPSSYALVAVGTDALPGDDNGLIDAQVAGGLTPPAAPLPPLPDLPALPPLPDLPGVPL